MTNTIETINGINKETGKPAVNTEILNKDIETKKANEGVKNVLNWKRSIQIDKELKARYSNYGLDVLYIRSKYKLIECIYTMANSSYNANLDNIIKVVKSAYIAKELPLDEMTEMTVLTEKQLKTVKTIVNTIKKHKGVNDSKEQIKLLKNVMSAASKHSDTIKELRKLEAEKKKEIYSSINSKLLNQGIKALREKINIAVNSKNPTAYNEAIAKLQDFYKVYFKVTIPESYAVHIYTNIVKVTHSMRYDNSVKLNSVSSFKNGLAIETFELFKRLVNKNNLYHWSKEKLPQLVAEFGNDSIVEFCKDIDKDLTDVINQMIKKELNNEIYSVSDLVKPIN